MMTKRVLLRASLLVTLAVSGMAANAAEQPPPLQQPAASPPNSAAQTQPRSGTRFLTQQSGRQMLSSNLIGMTVVNQTSNPIGNVANLVIDKSGRLVGVVVKVGGFLGLGAKRVALPLDEIRLDPGQKSAIVKLSANDLKNAPAYATLAEQNRTPEAKAQQSPAQQCHNEIPPPPRNIRARRRPMQCRLVSMNSGNRIMIDPSGHAIDAAGPITHLETDGCCTGPSYSLSLPWLPACWDLAGLPAPRPVSRRYFSLLE